MTLHVHFYGPPGAGKSTTTALAFGRLKQLGENVEYVGEFAKDLTWEKAFGKLSFQPYVTAKQMWRQHRLEGQVRATLTDTSSLLAMIYGTEEGGVTIPFEEWVVDTYRRMRTLNIYLQPSPERAYNASGRNQTAEEAAEAGEKIKFLLDDYEIPYHTFSVGDPAYLDRVVNLIQTELEAHA